MSSVTLAAAATHAATATATIARPGLARMLPQVICLIARENVVNHIDSARRTTRQRYATASCVVEVQLLRIWSRSSEGSWAGGSRRENADGRSAPQP